MREPEWIEHDGSAKCPAPYGHDVEVKRRNGATQRNCQPQDWAWYHDTYDRYNDITHYRDWTAFEQQNSAGDVPEWAKKRASDLVGSGHTFIAFARYIAAHQNSGVPKLLTEAEWLDWMRKPQSAEDALANLRERNLIAPEPEPVDPLRAEAQGIVRENYPAITNPNALPGYEVDLALAALRRGMELARGVTMEKNNG